MSYQRCILSANCAKKELSASATVVERHGLGQPRRVNGHPGHRRGHGFVRERWHRRFGRPASVILFWSACARCSRWRRTCTAATTRPTRRGISGSGQRIWSTRSTCCCRSGSWGRDPGHPSADRRRVWVIAASSSANEDNRASPRACSLHGTGQASRNQLWPAVLFFPVNPAWLQVPSRGLAALGHLGPGFPGISLNCKSTLNEKEVFRNTSCVFFKVRMKGVWRFKR